MSNLRAIVEEHYRYGNNHDLEADKHLFSPDVVTVFPGMEPMHSRDQFLAVEQAFFTALPDMQLRLTSIVESGNRAIAEGVLAGTHTGPLATPGGEIPPTGKSVEFSFADAFVIENGKVTEHRIYFDQLTLMRQLGLMPSEAAAAT